MNFTKVVTLNSQNGADVLLRTYSTNQPVLYIQFSSDMQNTFKIFANYQTRYFQK